MCLHSVRKVEHNVIVYLRRMVIRVYENSMAELALCDKKSKRAKKKEQRDARQLSLSNIPEEITSQDILQQCETAAENVLADILPNVAHLTLSSSHDSLTERKADSEEIPDEAEHLDDFNEINPPLQIDILQEENEIETDPPAFSTLNIDKNIVVDHASDEKLLENSATEDKHEISTSNHEDLMVSEISRGQLDSVDSEAFLTEKLEKGGEKCGYTEVTDETLIKEEEQQNRVLKPSVFVGRDKLYNSSLQVGCHWDRTKYNIVLLPDLNKVVYPDLDTLLFNKPSKDPFSSHGFMKHESFLPPIRIVDRSNKPKALTICKAEADEKDRSAVESSTNNLQKIKTKLDGLKNKRDALKASRKNVDELIGSLMEDAKDARFIDCSVDGIDFRVFMNPIKWSPTDNYRQLVLFRVGPLYYEDFFINCATTDGLLQAIKLRAEKLSKDQLTLAQKCLLTDYGDGNLFHIPNATLAIYAFPSEFNWESKQHIVRFGVNEAFYEEHFHGCKSFEDVVKAVKSRAEVICSQQSYLKAKAYSGKATVLESNRPKLWSPENGILLNKSDSLLNIENYDFDYDKDYNYQSHEKTVEGAGSNDMKADASVGHSDPAQKQNGFKGPFKSIRKWLKGAFSKKAGKPGSSLNTNNGGSNEIVWQWNNSPEASPSMLLESDSENVKE